MSLNPVARETLARGARAQLPRAVVAGDLPAGTLADLSRLDTEFHGLVIRGASNRRLQACWQETMSCLR